MPAGKLLPVRIGDADVYVDTLPAAVPWAPSPTSVFGRQRPQEAAGVEQVADVFSRVCSGPGGSLPDAEPGTAQRAADSTWLGNGRAAYYSLVE